MGRLLELSRGRRLSWACGPTLQLQGVHAEWRHGLRGQSVWPLVAAVHAGEIAAAELCVAHGAPVDTHAPSGDTLLVVAARRHEPGLVQLLLEAGAPLGPGANRTSALHAAAESSSGDHGACVRLLLEWGAEVDARDGDGNTPLVLAVQSLALDAASALLGAGADADAPSGGGLTPLQLCAQEDLSAFIPPLIEAGADVTARTEDGDDALILAVREGATKALKALLDVGADPDTPVPSSGAAPAADGGAAAAGVGGGALSFFGVAEATVAGSMMRPIDLARDERSSE